MRSPSYPDIHSPDALIERLCPENITPEQRERIADLLREQIPRLRSSVNMSDIGSAAPDTEGGLPAIASCARTAMGVLVSALEILEG